MVKILEKEQLAPNVHSCTVESPDIAKKAQAGQFVILIPDESSERIPISISDWDIEKGTVTIVFIEVGATTQKLASFNKGDTIYSFTGPLGKPYDIEKYGTVALVGGCYGIGAIYPAAKAFKAKGNKVICLTEARSSFLLYWNEKLKDVCDKIIYATVDGSLGETGHSHDVLDDMLKGKKYKEYKPDYVCAVGCTYMMYRVCEITKPFEIKTIVSMNPIMIDGTGMCGACRLVVDDSTKFACVDGPHFDGHKVDWNVALSRRKAYLGEEIISHERGE